MKSNSIILILLFGAAFALSGCRKGFTLKTDVEPGQRIESGAAVVADGEQIGFVRSLRSEGGDRIIAELAITNSTQRLRVGTIHVRERGRISLDTREANPAGALLKNGDFVPAHSKAAHIVQKWSKAAGLLLGFAVVVLAICLAKLLFFKLAGPLIPIVAALLLAAFTGWLVHPFVVPVVERCYNSLAGRIESGSASKTSDSGPEAAPSGISRWQSTVVRSLATRPDPRVVAFSIVSLATLPLWAWFVCWVRSFCRPSARRLLVPLVLWASMGAVLAAASDISYSREYLREEQATAQRFLAEAGRERAQAERLIDAGLVREAAEALALR